MYCTSITHMPHKPNITDVKTIGTQQQKNVAMNNFSFKTQ